MYRKASSSPSPPENFELPFEVKLSQVNRPATSDKKKQALEDEKIRNAIEGKFGISKRR